MNFTEQKNYIIAVFVSLTIHFFLLTIAIPAPKKTELTTFPVSLVEISPDDKTRQISVALNTSGKGSKKEEATAADTFVEKPDNQSVSRENTKIRSEVKPAHPLKDTALLSEEEAVAASDTSVKKPENQRASNGDAEELTGPGDSGVGEPQSFGTGEAMVEIIGPMPIYPPAALKEGKEGETALRILVNAGGQLELVIVTKSSGDIRLDYAAASSIERKWKFAPLNEGYYIDLVFSFDIHIGASVKFLASRTRS